MTKQLLLLLVKMMVFLPSYAQITFEIGYFINEADEKIECLIKNVDWENNPRGFEYKLRPDAPSQQADMESVKEFAIYNAAKYVRAKVDIDRSSNDLGNLSTTRNPDFQEEVLFLKVLIEGKATIFSFKEANLIRFFYAMNGGEIHQLVYKQYALNGNVGENNYFRQQLLTSLACDEIDLASVERLRYSMSDLAAIFIKYHHCMDATYTYQYIPAKRKDLFNLSIRLGISSCKVSIENPVSSYMNNHFENRFSPRIGIETEFVFSFQRNKWSFIAEPTFRTFQSENTKNTPQFTGGLLITKVQYQSMELPVGIRHYFFLNDQSKVFANIGYCLDFAFNSDFQFTAAGDRPVGSVKIKSMDNYFAGVGFRYQNRYSAEVRYFSDREILANYGIWRSNFQSLSVILGYSLF